MQGMKATGDRMHRKLTLITILAFATLAVAACGKRGVLEPPASADGTAPAHAKKHDDTTNALKKKSSTLDRSENARPKIEEAEHRPFILDGLLR
jgi:predicted small lipoprotein YifL